MFLLAVLLLLASAANAAAVGPRNATYDTTYDTTLTHSTAALNPPKLDSGPHWPHPSHKIDCDVTFQRYNNYAYLWTLVRIQVEWIREEGPKYWTLPEGTPKGTLVRVGCCNGASYNIVVQETLQKPIAIAGAEITTMGLAAADHCKQGDRTKGRAWAQNRLFTIEVFQDEHKCGKKCWQGD
ncbi:uncharacterized protein QC761_115970 [Podospora bellae-mahoneyi]|uniref:Ecp2 effector protein domain-containing protein n=1 Tax=Podospora bellae-mahoneyi TaxID=2093777 RepID=A0ABR0G067_9PEZI|nr:hypothetical protein QC761_115970 [Podospora bellae-mahoneyi]